MICEHGVDIRKDFPCAQCARAYRLFTDIAQEFLTPEQLSVIWQRVDAQLDAEFVEDE